MEPLSFRRQEVKGVVSAYFLKLEQNQNQDWVGVAWATQSQLEEAGGSRCQPGLACITGRNPSIGRKLVGDEGLCSHGSEGPLLLIIPGLTASIAFPLWGWMYEHLPREAHGCEHEHDRGLLFFFFLIFLEKAYISCPSSACTRGKSLLNFYLFFNSVYIVSIASDSCSLLMNWGRSASNFCAPLQNLCILTYPAHKCWNFS